jgi:TRAP transporter TAXI family solute receptor
LILKKNGAAHKAKTNIFCESTNIYKFKEKKVMQKKIIVVFIALALSFSGHFSKIYAAENLIIATATTGGTYYPVGVAIGTLISIKLAKNDKITATAINSAGSGENIQMLKNKEAEFAILQSLYGLNAFHGKDTYEGKAVKDFNSVTMLWENVEHFVLQNKYVNTGNITDLKGIGKKFSIGKRGSGTEGSGRTILNTLDIAPNKNLKLEYLAYNPSAQAMIDGKIVGANLGAGPPVAAVTQLFAQLGEEKLQVLNFTDEQLARIRKDYPIWSRYSIKSGTYPGQKKDINTIAQPNFLAVRADISEDTVYKITKTIYENLSFLTGIHKATRSIKLSHAIKGLPVPLHPGAVKYYLENGIKIPKSML